MRSKLDAPARYLAALCLIGAWLAPGRASAVEVENAGGYPLLIDVTNTAVLNYHFNNRNDVPPQISGLVDDNYGEWLDRLNVQLSWSKFRAGARIDAATYFLTPSPVQGTDYEAELHTRYRQTYYPSKLYLGYADRGIDVTVGDFYVQLGRGLVFSVRKIDELAVDTTVRGVKAVADGHAGPIHLSATAFAGQMNPLRVDEASGRRLNGDGSPLFFLFPRASPLFTSTIVGEPLKPGEPNGRFFPVREIDFPAPSYLEDTALGGHVEAGTKDVVLGANFAGLLRKSYEAERNACLASGLDSIPSATGAVLTGLCQSRFPEFSTTDQSRLHARIINASGSITVPSIFKHGDAYVEVAHQRMTEGQAGSADLDGYAVYASGSINAGPVSVSLEGKHYRRFYPLAANIDVTSPKFYAPEFQLITYSQPPTAEPIYVEPVSGGNPQVCVTGGRARVDYRFNRGVSAYAWLGRYTSWSERPVSNPNCDQRDEFKTNTWDAAVGTELRLEEGKTHVKAWIGARTSDEVVPEPIAGSSALTYAFYHEGYIRYDVVKHLTGPFSLQLQGFHRSRFEPASFAKPWVEGENYTALQWAPHYAAIMGFEYLTKEGCVPKNATRPQSNTCFYVNGGLQWRARAAEGDSVVKQIFDTVSLFVGQRRGAIRCVSGVCRQFPPFEGAKLELTSRF